MKQEGKFILFTREEFKDWLSKQNIKRQVTKIQQHHTWKPDYKNFKGNNHFSMVRGMESYHISQNYSEIGQNITLFPDGLIMICRSFEKDPAGISGQNENAICIENIGNFDIGADKISDEHKKTIILVNALLCLKFGLIPNENTIIYHAWFKLKAGGYKTCPGSNWFGGSSKQNALINFIPLVKVEYDKLKQPVIQEVKKLNYKEILIKVASNPTEWENAITVAVNAAKADGNLGTLEIFKYLPELIEKIYNSK